MRRLTEEREVILDEYTAAMVGLVCVPIFNPRPLLG